MKDPAGRCRAAAGRDDQGGRLSILATTYYGPERGSQSASADLSSGNSMLPRKSP